MGPARKFHIPAFEIKFQTGLILANLVSWVVDFSFWFLLSHRCWFDLWFGAGSIKENSSINVLVLEMGARISLHYPEEGAARVYHSIR